MDESTDLPARGRERLPRVPRDQMDPIKREILERIEAENAARESDPAWVTAREFVREARADWDDLLDGVPDDQRAPVTLHAYRDAEGRLCTRRSWTSKTGASRERR